MTADTRRRLELIPGKKSVCALLFLEGADYSARNNISFYSGSRRPKLWLAVYLFAE